MVSFGTYRGYGYNQITWGDPLLTRSMGSLIDATILPGGTETSGDVIRKTWISLPVAPLRNNRAVRYIAAPLALCP